MKPNRSLRINLGVAARTVAETGFYSFASKPAIDVSPISLGGASTSAGRG